MSKRKELRINEQAWLNTPKRRVLRNAPPREGPWIAVCFIIAAFVFVASFLKFI